MPYASAGDLRMYYEEHGQPDGPALVLLHGFTETGAAWRPYLAAFGARYRLLVPDWRGHGRTANPGGLAAMNHRQFGRDIIALCRTLGVGRAIFCGESSGAELLLTLALEAPDLPAALVLGGGTYVLPEESRAWMRGLTPDTIDEGWRTSLQHDAHSAQGPDHWRTVVAALSALGDHAPIDDYPEREELRGITAPTLVMHGDRDPIFPLPVPTELYGLLPDAELCILPNTGHTPVGQRPEWFAPITLDFLQRRAIDERPAE